MWMLGGIFLMWVSGSLISSAWIDDEPDNACERNIVNDVFGIGRYFSHVKNTWQCFAGKRRYQGYHEDYSWTCGEAVLWYLRGVVATIGYFIHLNGLWNLLDRLWATCTSDDIYANYCYSWFRGRNVLIMFIGLFMLW